MSRRTEYFAFKGGINTTDANLVLPPGELISCGNYEAPSGGGYRRIDGYERFDGQQSPADEGYWLLDFNTGGNAPSAGDEVTGGTSSATGVVVTLVLESGTWAGGDAAGYLVLRSVSGTFEAAEDLEVGATLIALAVGAAVDRGSDDDTLDLTYLHQSMEAARTAIAAVPGSGSVLGVWRYNDVTYAFRNHTDGLSAKMWKSTAAGWVEIVTGVVLAPSGDYRFTNHNFGGHSGSVKMYGTDGANKGFQFDGTTFTQITTGMTTDKPINLCAHKNHLFFVFSGGSVQHSSIGDPLTWSVITGAGEITLGDENTGIISIPGEALALFCRNSRYILYGSSALDWNLVAHSLSAGAIDGTVQDLGLPVYWDDRGINLLQQSDQFGDVKSNAISDKFDRILTEYKASIAATLRIRSKTQYRLFFTDGIGLSVTFDNLKLVGATMFELPIIVSCTCSSEDRNGDERLFVGATNGFVYEMDKGTNFDGAEVQAWIRPVFAHFKSPQTRKKFFKVVLDVRAESEVDLTFYPEYGYGDSYYPADPESASISIAGGGSTWDSTGEWERFYWDAPVISNAYAYLSGIGENISLLIKSTGTYEKPHTLQGVIFHLSDKGVVR